MHGLGVIEVPPLSHHSRNASRKKTVRQKAAAAAAAAATAAAQQKARDCETGSSKRSKAERAGRRPGGCLELPDDATNWDLVDLERTAGLIGGGDLPAGDPMPALFDAKNGALV